MSQLNPSHKNIIRVKNYVQFIHYIIVVNFLQYNGNRKLMCVEEGGSELGFLHGLRFIR